MCREISGVCHFVCVHCRLHCLLSRYSKLRQDEGSQERLGVKADIGFNDLPPLDEQLEGDLLEETFLLRLIARKLNSLYVSCILVSISFISSIIPRIFPIILFIVIFHTFYEFEICL